MVETASIHGSTAVCTVFTGEPESDSATKDEINVPIALSAFRDKSDSKLSCIYIIFYIYLSVRGL